MGRYDHLKKGEWNVICDRCGFKFKSSKLRLEWDKLRVCRHCWEVRHPLDYLRAVRDPQVVPWTRPQPPDVFVDD